MEALKGLAWLLVCQSLGEVASRSTGVGLPGPVIGLLILLVALNAAVVRIPVSAAADALLAHLSLLFVPVGVGVMTHLALVSEYGLRLLLVLAVSTWMGMAVTVLTLRALWPREES
jgi:holin-like protein